MWGGVDPVLVLDELDADNRSRRRPRDEPLLHRLLQRIHPVSGCLMGTSGVPLATQGLT